VWKDRIGRLRHRIQVSYITTKLWSRRTQLRRRVRRAYGHSVQNWRRASRRKRHGLRMQVVARAESVRSKMMAFVVIVMSELVLEIRGGNEG
jgi:hypothetical protein